MAELKNNSIIDCNKIFEKKSSDVSEQSLLDEINNVLGDAEIFNDFDRKIIVTNEGLLFNTDSTGRFILISMMISCWIGLLTILALQSLLTIHIFFPLFLLFLTISYRLSELMSAKSKTITKVLIVAIEHFLLISINNFTSKSFL